MASFLDNILGSATEVYIAVSPSNRIEMGVLDPHTHLVNLMLMLLLNIMKQSEKFLITICLVQN